MKKFICLFSILLLCIGTTVYADTGDYVETVKYYKTVTYTNWDDQYVTTSINSIGDDNVNHNSITYEITEEEYNNSDNSLQINNVIETNYKKMSTSITKTGSLYRYKVNLHWKNMPSRRSYDIIGIGFPSSVKRTGSQILENKFCTSSTNCSTSSSYPYSYSGNYGAGVTFGLPSGNYVSMDQTLSFIVEKNTSATILRQYAYGDYSHATKSISLTNAKKYTVHTTGIDIDASVFTYYDDIPTADAYWEGSW